MKTLKFCSSSLMLGILIRIHARVVMAQLPATGMEIRRGFSFR